jgi:hypothetical protein
VLLLLLELCDFTKYSMTGSQFLCTLINDSIPLVRPVSPGCIFWTVSMVDWVNPRWTRSDLKKVESSRALAARARKCDTPRCPSWTWHPCSFRLRRPPHPKPHARCRVPTVDLGKRSRPSACASSQSLSLFLLSSSSPEGVASSFSLRIDSPFLTVKWARPLHCSLSILFIYLLL